MAAFATAQYPDLQFYDWKTFSLASPAAEFSALCPSCSIFNVHLAYI